MKRLNLFLLAIAMMVGCNARPIDTESNAAIEQHHRHDRFLGYLLHRDVRQCRDSGQELETCMPDTLDLVESWCAFNDRLEAEDVFGHPAVCDVLDNVISAD